MNDSLRDVDWLRDRLRNVWTRGFPDLVPQNRVVIRFGRVARTRLGSIRMSRDKKVSKILVNRLFQNPKVPVEIVDATIAHELTHYLHGFSSPLEQKYCTPHAGGVVTKELEKRGFDHELIFQKRWLKTHWPLFLREHAPSRRRRRRTIPRRRLTLRRVIRALT